VVSLGARDTLSDLMSKTTSVVAGRAYGRRRPASSLAGAVVLMSVLVIASGGVAWAVVRGKTVAIAAVPWTAVIWEKSPYPGQPPYAACTGVVIGPRYVLTAGHCVMSGNSARLLPKSATGVETGTSNFERADQ